MDPSSTAAFGPVLPTVGEAFGADDPWRFAAAAPIALLSEEERAQLARWMWALVVVGNGLFALVLALGLLGMLAIPVAGAVFCALLWQLILSTILFTRLVMSM